MKKKLIKPLLKKVSRINLEGQIRLLKNDLNIIKRQLKRGVNREKLATKKFRGQVSQGENREQLGADREKQGADREKLGADREKQGANREKLSAGRERLAEEQFRLQTDEIEFKDGQLKQGADREKLAEEQIHIRTKAMESTFDGIFIIDAKKPDFPIIYANPSFYNLTGYSKNEVIGKNYFLLYGNVENSHVYGRNKTNLASREIFSGGDAAFQKER